MSKTPVTILQEMMVKLGQIPTYECVGQTGPPHLATFEYRCVANGVSGSAKARSKKEAKQEAARAVLQAMAPGAAPPAPPHLALPPGSQSGEGEGGKEGEAGAGAGAAPRHSSVALLKELCEQYRLGAVEYAVVGDTGPPHDRRFTVRAALGRHQRLATAPTKKLARQLAADQLYSYLRENLASVTKDFVENNEPNLGEKIEQATKGEEIQVKESRKRKTNLEENQNIEGSPNKRSCDSDSELETLLQNAFEQSEDALARALDKVMARYVEMKEEQPWMPDLSQRVADYHRGLSDSISEEQRRAAQDVLGEEGKRVEVEEDEEEVWAKLRATADALGLSVEVEQLAADGGALSVVALSPTAPALTLAGRRPRDAAAAALRYLRRALALRPKDQTQQTPLALQSQRAPLPVAKMY